MESITARHVLRATKDRHNLITAVDKSVKEPFAFAFIEVPTHQGERLQMIKLDVNCNPTNMSIIEEVVKSVFELPSANSSLDFKNRPPRTKRKHADKLSNFVSGMQTSPSESDSDDSDNEDT